MKKTERQRLGDYGERRAALAYFFRGAILKKKNYRVGHLEIDLILESPRYIIFSEVKTRHLHPEDTHFYGSPSAAVTAEKQKNLIAAARKYLVQHPTKKKIRMDVVEVYAEPNGRGGFRLRHLEIFPDAYHA